MCHSIHDHHLMLQHDNARPHVARICTQFLEAENIPVLAWPAYSPDMSPIEHVWDALDRRIRQRVPVPANIQQLHTYCLNFIENIKMEKFLVRTNKPTDAPPAAKKLRRYDEAYLQFGFTVTADLRPQCVVCAEVLANDSMKPCKLKRHLETKHAGIKNKPAEYFKRKLDGLHQQQATISVHSTVSKQCLEASYVVAKRIGKLGKPHTIAETLILPAAQDMCRIMIGDSAAANLGAVPLFNDTVARRIEDMSNDIREQLIEFVKKSPYYVLQLDESTDIAGQSQLLTYVRYLRDKAIEEDVLFCRPLQSHTTGEAIFNVLDIFIRENGLAWDRCVGLCTDGAQAMTGRERGLAARVQQVAPLVKWTHCMVHREALAAKKNAGSF